MANPILYPAPPWQPPRSEYIVLWHGCTVLDKNGIEAGGIDLKYSAVNTDFGRGFYTTTFERQARFWAWDRYYRWRGKNPPGPANQPVVLRFRVRRYRAVAKRAASGKGKHGWADGLDELLTLPFVRGTYGDVDYWSLVQHCRQSIPADPTRAVAEDAHDHGRPPDRWYELVCGPVAAFWEQRVAMVDADQYSFHASGIDLLNALIGKGKGRGSGGQGDPDYYRWEVVT